MGIPVLIMGESGSGKTYSIKNFDKDEVGVFLIEKTRLPFKKDFKTVKNATYHIIMKALSQPTLKKYVIDDSQYLLVNEMFDRIKEAGYGKYTDIALNFRNLIHYINKNLPDDVIVYFLHHTETDSNTGKVKAKTIGKMLDEKLTVEGCFDIVLSTEISNGKHYFITQSNGTSTVKSPEDMFKMKIDNDLKMVDATIREYYGMEEKTEEKSETDVPKE